MIFKTIRFSILILLAFAISSCIFIKPVEISRIEKIDVENLSLSNAKLKLSLKINNPNFVKIKITDINLDVFVRDEKIGKIEETDSFEIKANKNENIDVQLNVSFSNLITKAYRIIKLLSGSDAKIKLKGTIGTKALFFSREIENSGRRFSTTLQRIIRFFILHFAKFCFKLF